MSRIFEALKKTQGELADLALPVVGEEIPAADPARASSAQTPEAEPISLPFQPDAPMVAGQEEAFGQDVPADGFGPLRTLPVRIRADAPILPFQPGHCHEGEQYRIARTKIIQHPDQPRLIVVSSPGSGDGKTVSAINLAGALALKSDSQVMLVDADLRRSNAASLLGLPEQPGLAEYLGGKCNLDDIIIRVEQFPNLCVVPAGKAIANPTELLDSPRWASVCAKFRRQSKFVIFDAPPIETVADFDLICAACDGVIFVVRPDRTNRKLCLEGLASVPQGKLIGVLMNCVEDWFLWKTKGYYSYSAPSRGR
jgi:receptor protein-tyrosine kinase